MGQIWAPRGSLCRGHLSCRLRGTQCSSWGTAAVQAQAQTTPGHTALLPGTRPQSCPLSESFWGFPIRLHFNYPVKGLAFTECFTLLQAQPSLPAQHFPKIAASAYWASHVLLCVFTVFLACYLKSHCSHTTDCLYYSNSHNIVSHLATFSQINWKLSQSPIALEKAMITNETNLAQLSSFWHPLLAVTD